MKLQIKKLIKFSNKFGLAFQIRDDILDEIGDEAKIGKPIKSDIKNNKSTYPSIMGIEKSQKKAELLIGEALGILNELPFKTDKLESLCELVIKRKIEMKIHKDLPKIEPSTPLLNSLVI